MRFKEIS